MIYSGAVGKMNDVGRYDSFLREVLGGFYSKHRKQMLAYLRGNILRFSDKMSLIPVVKEFVISSDDPRMYEVLENLENMEKTSAKIIRDVAPPKLNVDLGLSNIERPFKDFGGFFEAQFDRNGGITKLGKAYRWRSGEGA
jgi:hypothetical protein